MTSTYSSCSSAWAARPPQNVPRPVTRTRLPTPHALTPAQHVVKVLLDLLTDRLRLFHHATARIARLVGCDIEVHGVEHAEPELRGEVDEQAGGTEHQHVRRDGRVRQPEDARNARHRGEDRHRLLGTD